MSHDQHMTVRWKAQAKHCFRPIPRHYIPIPVLRGTQAHVAYQGRTKPHTTAPTEEEGGREEEEVVVEKERGGRGGGRKWRSR